MNYPVNGLKKKEIQKKIYRYRPRVLALRILAYLMVLLAVWGFIIMVLSDANNTLDPFGILACAIGIVMFFAFLTIARGLAGLEAKWRLHESLFIKNNEIHYIYALHNFSEDAGKFVVVIPFDRLVKIVYDAKTEGLTFYGKIYSGYTDKPAVGDTVIDQGKMKKFVIHDYFEPTLKDALENVGIAVQKG